jgi:hypothetical protein
MRLRLSANAEGLMATQSDREAEDLGNVVMLEHVNLQIPDQVIRGKAGVDIRTLGTKLAV